MNEVVVEYFANLREEAGVSRELVDTAAATMAELYAEVRGRHGLSLDATILRVACNDEFVAWHTAVRPGDRVAFIPPVSGG